MSAQLEAALYCAGKDADAPSLKAIARQEAQGSDGAMRMLAAAVIAAGGAIRVDREVLERLASSTVVTFTPDPADGSVTITAKT